MVVKTPLFSNLTTVDLNNVLVIFRKVVHPLVVVHDVIPEPDVCAVVSHDVVVQVTVVHA